MSGEGNLVTAIKDTIVNMFGSPYALGLLLVVFLIIVAIVLALPSIILLGATYFLVFALSLSGLLPGELKFILMLVAAASTAIFLLAFVRR